MKPADFRFVDGALMETNLPLSGRRRGKVRDNYDIELAGGKPGMLMVATDRISAFDVVMPNGIPGKGVILTSMSAFWLRMLHMSSHLVSTFPSNVGELSENQRRLLHGRVMVVQKARVIPIECIVRGYITGSGWKSYQKDGTVCGIQLPAGLKQCQKLPQPIFTPSTKAETGHDENISFDEGVYVLMKWGGPKTKVDEARIVMRRIMELSLQVYNMAHDFAAARGVIIADTKFEFGLHLEGGLEPMLIDEVLTPDSSRFWPADKYEPGRDQESFDKQQVRNYLEGLCNAGQWNKQAPGPVLPREVVLQTQRLYKSAFEKLAGQFAPLLHEIPMTA